MGLMDKMKETAAKTADAAKGAALAQRCIMCHQLNGNGPAYGPELKGWAARQSREALVRAIVNPSADIALGYEGVTLKLKAVAERHAKGRIVSCLEGGYHLGALGRSVEAHLRVLADL